MRIKRIISICIAMFFSIGLCSCGGGSGSSETNTERSAIKGTELSRQKQAADADNNSSDKNTEIPVLGGWRALELKKAATLKLITDLNMFCCSERTDSIV